MSRRDIIQSVILRVIEIALLGAICFFVVSSIAHLQKESAMEGRKCLETSVKRAAMACYASEGMFPDNVDYLCSHYGLQIDDKLYTVHYYAFAENIMPDITVTINR